MRYPVHRGLLANTRCINGRLWRHDPQNNDPDFVREVGWCPECEGAGCDRPSDDRPSDGLRD